MFRNDHQSPFNGLFTGLVAVILGIFAIGVYSYARHQRSEEFYSGIIDQCYCVGSDSLRSYNLSRRPCSRSAAALKTLPSST